MRDSWQSLYKKLRGNHSYMHILYCRCIKAILPNCCQSRDYLSTSANLSDFPPILPTVSLWIYSQTSYYTDRLIGFSPHIPLHAYHEHFEVSYVYIAQYMYIAHATLLFVILACLWHKALSCVQKQFSPAVAGQSATAQPEQTEEDVSYS